MRYLTLIAIAVMLVTAGCDRQPLPDPETLDEMVLVPAGEFIMGSNPDEPSWDNEYPKHTVYLDAFYIDKYEVTNSRYQSCVDAGQCSSPSETKSDTRKRYFGEPKFAVYPVIYVDWAQANTFCEWEGKRLPTEAEWEKAARGTDGQTYPWGSAEPSCDVANYTSECVGDTTPVGAYPAGASPYGALDMGGNVWEWVADWYQADYYVNSPLQNPQGPSEGEYRILRGGSWHMRDSVVRTAYRKTFQTDYSYYYIGFRCARNP